MKIAQNMVVELAYELTVDGTVVDKAVEESPLDYIHGTHMLLEKFESEIEGLSPGDTFSFVLSPEEGYGPYDSSKVISIPKSGFIIDGVLHEELLVLGRTLPMLDAYGQVVKGTVIEIGEDDVKMDFNQPFAGKSLSFTGKVLTVREATEKELQEGLHGEYLPQEGCHCHGKGRCHHHGEGKGHCHNHGEGEEGCCGKGDGCCENGEGEGCCCDEGEGGRCCC